MASKTYIEWKNAKELMDLAWGNYLKSLSLVQKIDEWGVVVDDSNPVANLIVEIHHALYVEAEQRYKEAKNAHFHKRDN